MSHPTDKIRELLINGKEYKALKALVDLLKSKPKGKALLNNAFLLQSRLESIETKFNEGITTFEKWKVSRTKIIKSTLDFLNQVENTISQEDIPDDTPEVITAPVVSNESFIHKLANPVFIRRMSFYFLGLWIFLGALDTLFFQVRDSSFVKAYSLFGIGFKTYVPDGSIVTWLRDFTGHLFAFGTVVLVIIIEVVKTYLMKTSNLVLNKVNDLYRKYFFLFTIGCGVFIAAAIFSNTNYITQESDINLWSKEISPSFLPPFVAVNYFILVMIPLLLGIFHYCLLLHVTIKEYKSYATYNPFHGDKNFGLLIVGRSIFWGTLAFVVLMLLALVLQLIFKNGELTFGIFSGTFLFLTVVWFGAINPLRKLSAKLSDEKERLYESVKEEVRSNNRMLANQTSSDDFNNVKLLLDASRDNEKELLALSVLPITRNELLLGAGIVVLLLGMIVYQIA